MRQKNQPCYTIWVQNKRQFNSVWPIATPYMLDQNWSRLSAVFTSTHVVLLSIWPLGTNFSEISVELYNEMWWCHQMETFSAYLAFCAENSPVTGEFPSQRSVTRSFDVFFDLCLNQQLSKQWRRRWFESPSRSFWRHCNGENVLANVVCQIVEAI